jgi:hypothetical protein
MVQRGIAVAQSASVETFSITLALVVPVADLRGWFENAAPRERAIYASGIELPRDEPGVVLVREWAQAEEVRTFQRRDPLDLRRWQFLIERCDTESARAREVRPDLAAQQLIALHRALVEAAAGGLPCPSRTDLARKATGQETERARERVRWLMKRLEAEGKIAITPAPRGAQHGPTVTILTGKHAGKATAAPLCRNTQRGV